MKYLIDGYNLIHKIAQLQGKRLRNQREGLVRLLEMTRAKNNRVKDLTIVFDGRSGVLAYPLRSAVKIVFSKGSSADKKIKEILETSNFARDITVVSDDRQVRFYAGSLGAKKISVKEFLNLVYSPGEEKCSFKLDRLETEKINQELEKIWLGK